MNKYSECLMEGESGEQV